MLALLVLPLWLGLFRGFSCLFPGRRDAILAASTCWGVAVLIIIEGLSVFDALRFWPLITVWTLVCVTAIAAWAVLPSPSASAGRVLFQTSEGPLQRLMIGGIAFILLAIACVAIVSPPNNYDSMTYHLTRVLNWIAHQSVRHYPTHDIRQLYLGPWAEFAILHFQILSGGDRFAACVQYAAMLGSVVGVSRVAQQLGADPLGQVFASVFCATIPMGILQASSTQNDYVNAFWLLCFVHFVLGATEHQSPFSWVKATLGGASLGLAVLTKLTAVFFAAPFALWLGAVWLARPRTIAVARLAWMVFLIALLNAPHLLRNRHVFGSFVPKDQVSLVANEIHSPAAVASNLIRNLAVHEAGLPVGREAVVAAVNGFHRWIGQDIKDQRTTYAGHDFVLGPPLHEDTAGNPLHLILLGIAVVIGLRPGSARPLCKLYAVCILMGFVLFCAIVKWQPWASRLQLPCFVLAAPLCGLAFDQPCVRRFSPRVEVVLIVAALLPTTMNATRPLLSKRASIFSQQRTALYFMSRPALKDPFLAATAELSQMPAYRIGMICEADCWEYPLRILIAAASGSQFEYVGVNNASSRIGPVSARDLRRAQAIVVVDDPLLPDELRSYKAAFVSPSIRVYRPPHQ